ncbi:MAG TPA: SRPBCC family protein [Candidatus Saccharimonadia bacterium]|nr:SRPBCC family protein [Candidatus Saccharimonadia bacterium]
MITTSSVVAIKRPSREVFAFVCDPARAPQWHTGVTHFRATNGLPAGSEGELTMVIMGRQLHSTFVILENDGTETTKSRSVQGPIRYETTQRVESVSSSSCRVSIHTRIDAGTVFMLAEPALESIARYYADMDLQTLKTILEASLRLPNL